MSAPKPAKVKVAIIGGGCAGMTAAFELTRPEHAGRYEVTVYQPGWRLGGKGASSRGPADRIEEHGLHLWMGYYDNAFRLMRECYEELARDPAASPIVGWRDAFVPADTVGAAYRTSAGGWAPWVAKLPRMPGLPGDPGPAPATLTLDNYLVRTIGLVSSMMRAVAERAGVHSVANLGAMLRTPERAAEGMRSLFRMGMLGGLGGALESLHALQFALESAPGHGREHVLRLLELASNAIKALIDDQVRDRDDLRPIADATDIALASVRGALRAGLASGSKGFDVLDDFECRDFLAKHGASARALDSGFLRGLYDLGFAYEDGEQPRISTAAAMRGAHRLFYTYRGAFFWKMTAGMGEIVFAPLYELLVRPRRQVRVLSARGQPAPRPARAALARRGAGGRRAGHDGRRAALPAAGERSRAAVLAGFGRLRAAQRRRPASRRGTRIRVDVGQATRRQQGPARRRGLRHGHPRGGPGRGARGLPGDRRARRTLEGHGPARQGGPHAGVPAVDEREPARSRVARRRRQRVGLRQALRHVGRHEPPRAQRGLAVGAAIDRLLLLGDGDAGGRGVAVSGRLRQEVRRRATRFLDEQMGHLWPRATSGGRFRWDLLQTPPGTAPGPADSSRFASQHYVANVNPTDWYTLAVPGSRRHRVSPLDDTYDNLRVAGDWTDTRLNLGSVEGAVISGRLAAHAISGSPRLSEIVGYDSP
jgi:uncharacterized protein with NAD-binding domain and iron-sulfur cluster